MRLATGRSPLPVAETTTHVSGPGRETAEPGGAVETRRTMETR